METWQNLLLKAVLMLVTAPAWYPFLKAVWEELNDSMAEEGGLFGRPPTARELEEIEQEKRYKRDPLIHEPWPSREERMRGRKTMGGKSGGGDDADEGAARGPSRPVRRRGF